MPAPQSLWVFHSSDPDDPTDWDAYHAARLAAMTPAERIADRWNESREAIAWVTATHRAGLPPLRYGLVERR